MQPILTVTNLSKAYASGFQALKNVHLEIQKGEIFALLGPNGAGKTTLISIICGIVTASSGQVRVGGHDIVRDYRQARSLIGLVPQELTTDAFETVLGTVSFSRGLFGKPRNDAFIEQVLRDLSLWDKRHSRLYTLSGGMKRRVLIAKALSHEPQILFLDEPTAGVDVELRRDMWQLVRRLSEQGVTVILTTHYIEEAEEMADRIGVINRGEIILVEGKRELMCKLGRKQVFVRLVNEAIPPVDLQHTLGLEATPDAREWMHVYDPQQQPGAVPTLLRSLAEVGLHVEDIRTEQSSLEEIFVSLVAGSAADLAQQRGKQEVAQ